MFLAGIFGAILMTVYRAVVPQRFWLERHLVWIAKFSWFLSLLSIAYILFLIVKLIML
ncbi:MAG: hypothetical protein UX18_C0023G0009 [Candidatus Azambacteria bacterium GW2011_GWC2_45_7b]|nr:MAG: hypothetical protein UX18_C0023G0009 [Candidatus Azambacteria bacterium GW2011_GWC2_45_7b]